MGRQCNIKSGSKDHGMLLHHPPKWPMRTCPYPTPGHPWNPCPSANLGGVMNGNARLSRAGRQSSQSSARRCARRLPLLLIFYPCGLNRIPIEGGTVDDQPLRALSQDFKEAAL